MPTCDLTLTYPLQIGTDFVLVDANQDLNTGDPPADYLVFLEEGAEYSLSALQAEFGTTDFALLCVTLPLPFDQQPFQIGSVGLRDNIYRTHEGTAGNNSGKGAGHITSRGRVHVQPLPLGIGAASLRGHTHYLLLDAGGLRAWLSGRLQQ